MDAIVVSSELEPTATDSHKPKDVAADGAEPVGSPASHSCPRGGPAFTPACFHPTPSLLRGGIPLSPTPALMTSAAPLLWFLRQLDFLRSLCLLALSVLPHELALPVFLH